MISNESLPKEHVDIVESHCRVNKRGSLGVRDLPHVLRVVNLVSRTGKYGGPSDTAYRQAEIFSQDGEVTFVAGYFGGDRPDLPGSERLSVELYQSRPFAPSFPFPSAFSLKGLHSLWLAVGKADVVHISFAREVMPLLATAFSLMRHRPTVVQPHGMLTSRSGLLQRFLDLAAKPLFARATLVVALTDTEARDLRSWIGPHCPVVVELHNPLVSAVSDQVPERPHENEVLFLGRLHKRKRLDVFIDAGALAKSNGWADRYVVVGPDEGELARVKSAIDRGDLARYEQSVPPTEVARRVGGCAVFVLTSEREPWGNVTAVALSLARPVVVTESSAIAPLIGRHAAGAVVPDGDPVSVANAVHGILVDADLYAAMSRGAAELAAHHLSDDYQRERLLGLYQQAVGRATGPDR